MDFSTVTGLLLGVIILSAALLIGGVPIQTLLQPQGLLIVFGGTLTAVLIHFSYEDIQQAIGSLRTVLVAPETDIEEVVEVITDAAVYIRTKGLLSVQPLLAHVEVPFLQKGLQMIVDNQPTEYIRSQLTTEMEVHYKTQSRCASVFESAGGFAPTLGIIGAIVGLIQVMGLFNSPAQLGHGVANAFIATLYGVGSANLFLLPIAGKLKQRAKEDWFLKSLILQGLIAIREGENPMMIQEKLGVYLQPETTQDNNNIQQPAYADDYLVTV